ncbi:hypothetical protein [Povalibacter sp.]|uniref:hypothetical protein n=1 Tax=Povalibacter sp. TaxID=1962978 RepID=UPI002F400B65
MTKIRMGDVFQFDVAGDHSGYGQIVVPGDVIYVIVCRSIHRRSERSFEPQLLSDIGLCGWTLDGRIYHGMWRVIAHAPLPDHIPRPCYKVAKDEVQWVESFEGKLQRQASERDCRALDYRTTVAPIRFENAFAALHGLREWDASFDKMRVEYACEQERACGGLGGVKH